MSGAMIDAMQKMSLREVVFAKDVLILTSTKDVF
jgi:hypothetical protein